MQPSLFEDEPLFPRCFPVVSTNLRVGCVAADPWGAHVLFPFPASQRHEVWDRYLGLRVRGSLSAVVRIWLLAAQGRDTGLVDFD